MIDERAGNTPKSLKFLGWIMRSKKEDPAVPPALTKDHELLAEIRDLLRARG
jgi:large-conductance mechanosensitive channel